jgi:hypothetical protein
MATADKFKALLDHIVSALCFANPTLSLCHSWSCVLTVFHWLKACGWFGSFVLLSMLKWRHGTGRWDHLTRAPL